MKKGSQKIAKLQSKLRTRRIFSDTFKKQRVEEITSGLATVLEVSRLYKVSSQSVYKWLYKYSQTHQKGVVQVVQMESEAHKNKEFLKRIAELERVVGQKQMHIDYLDKLVEISSKELKVDLKKNFGTKPWPSSTNVRKQEDTK